MSFKPISVTQLNTYIKQIFDSEELLHGISVYGEISGWSVTRGTAYFTLKDENSALNCVCFDLQDSGTFKDGDSVMVIGSTKYYSKGGKLNFNAIKIEPYGESILYKRFLELKDTLQKNGYFDESTKLDMPKEIKSIGVVTSAEGAVIQDIINIRTRRNPSVDIVLYPTKVQGVGAENEIAKGIRFFNNYNVDVIVVARGGGSFEDLMPFNTIEVANAVHDCTKFIVSAVGHETDFTICDFCSDLRAPTPSAAAELLCTDISSLKQKVVKYSEYLIKQIKCFKEEAIDGILSKVNELKQNYDNCFNEYQNFFNEKIKELHNMSNIFLIEPENKLNLCTKMIDRLNPNEVLKLGYCAIKLGNNYISSVKDVDVGDNVSIKLCNGNLDAKITNLEELWVLNRQWNNWKI